MTLAVRGISQHTFCELRFADLLFVTGASASHASSRTVRRKTSVAGSYGSRLLMGCTPHVSPRSASMNQSRLAVEHMTMTVTSCFQRCDLSENPRDSAASPSRWGGIDPVRTNQADLRHFAPPTTNPVS